MRDFRDKKFHVQTFKEGLRKLYKNWQPEKIEQLVTDDFRLAKQVVARWWNFIFLEKVDPSSRKSHENWIKTRAEVMDE